jgi:hypothetical protein
MHNEYIHWHTSCSGHVICVPSTCGAFTPTLWLHLDSHLCSPEADRGMICRRWLWSRWSKSCVSHCFSKTCTLFPRLHPGSSLSFFRRFQCNSILLPWQLESVGTCWNHHEPAISAEGVDTLCIDSWWLMIVDAQAVPVLICCVRPLPGELATVHAVQSDKRKKRVKISWNILLVVFVMFYLSCVWIPRAQVQTTELSYVLALQATRAVPERSMTSIWIASGHDNHLSESFHWDVRSMRGEGETSN